MPSINTDEWLGRVFNAPGAGLLADTYDAWAASYDADMLPGGYLHPAVAAGFVGRYVRALEGPILDAGAGTGIVEQILFIVRFRNLVGVDILDGMLARARERGVYAVFRNLLLLVGQRHPRGSAGYLGAVRPFHAGCAGLVTKSATSTPHQKLPFVSRESDSGSYEPERFGSTRTGGLKQRLAPDE